MASQIEGGPAYKAPTADEAPWTRPDAAQTILANSGAVIRSGGDRAFYSPSTDHIQLPPDAAFLGAPQWAATALHELGHWTGAKHRLDRDMSGGFGSAKYAEEELVAELGSYFTSSTLNLPTDCTQNAAYIGHWRDKTIGEIAYSKHMGDRFGDFLEMAYCALAKPMVLGGGDAADRLEERYMAVVKRNKPEDIQRMPELLGLTVSAVSEGGCGRAKDGLITLSVDCFDKGTKFLASTIFEEYVHCKYGFQDESRQLQEFLFDRIVTMGEEYVTGEPL